MFVCTFWKNQSSCTQWDVNALESMNVGLVFFLVVLLSHTWTESKAGTLIAQHRRCSTALASRAKWCSSSASQSQRTAHQPCSCSWPRSLWRGSPTLVRGHVRQSPPPPARTPGPPYSPPRSEAPSRSASHERSGPAWVWCPVEQRENVMYNV